MLEDGFKKNAGRVRANRGCISGNHGAVLRVFFLKRLICSSSSSLLMLVNVRSPGWYALGHPPGYSGHLRTGSWPAARRMCGFRDMPAGLSAGRRHAGVRPSARSTVESPHRTDPISRKRYRDHARIDTGHIAGRHKDKIPSCGKGAGVKPANGAKALPDIADTGNILYRQERVHCTGLRATMIISSTTPESESTSRSIKVFPS